MLNIHKSSKLNLNVAEVLKNKCFQERTSVSIRMLLAQLLVSLQLLAVTLRLIRTPREQRKQRNVSVLVEYVSAFSLKAAEMSLLCRKNCLNLYLYLFLTLMAFDSEQTGNWGCTQQSISGQESNLRPLQARSRPCMWAVCSHCWVILHLESITTLHFVHVLLCYSLITKSY